MSLSNVKVSRSNNMQIKMSKQNDHVLCCFRNLVWASDLSCFKVLEEQIQEDSNTVALLCCFSMCTKHVLPLTVCGRFLEGNGKLCFAALSLTRARAKTP